MVVFSSITTHFDAGHFGKSSNIIPPSSRGEAGMMCTSCQNQAAVPTSRLGHKSMRTGNGQLGRGCLDAFYFNYNEAEVAACGLRYAIAAKTFTLVVGNTRYCFWLSIPMLRSALPVSASVWQSVTDFPNICACRMAPFPSKFSV